MCVPSVCVGSLLCVSVVSGLWYVASCFWYVLFCSLISPWCDCISFVISSRRLLFSSLGVLFPLVYVSLDMYIGCKRPKFDREMVAVCECFYVKGFIECGDRNCANLLVTHFLRV
jgi:hypothetical protein